MLESGLFIWFYDNHVYGGTMAEKTVLLDLDGTIIGNDYQLTVPEQVFAEAIARAQSKNLKVGLSSDSGSETLKAFAKRLGMNGPIVAEKGAVIAFPEESFRVHAETAQFTLILEAFVLQLVKESLAKKLLLVLGDVNGMSRSMMTPVWADSSSPLAVLVNTLRCASLSFFARANRTGWVMDGGALDYVFEVAMGTGHRIAPKWWSRIVIDKNPDYGICIIHHPDTDKRNALSALRERGYDGPLYMVGNSRFDWLGEGVTHYAVANATADFKEMCTSHVSSKPLTVGVIEILDRIADE